MKFKKEKKTKVIHVRVSSRLFNELKNQKIDLAAAVRAFLETVVK